MKTKQQIIDRIKEIEKEKTQCMKEGKSYLIIYKGEQIKALKWCIEGGYNNE